MPVVIDLSLTSNEVLYFSQDRVQLIDKNKIKEHINRPKDQLYNLKKKQMYGNVLRAKIVERLESSCSPIRDQQF